MNRSIYCSSLPRHHWGKFKEKLYNMTAFSVAVIISGELPVSVIEGLYIRILLSLSLSLSLRKVTAL